MRKSVGDSNWKRSLPHKVSLAGLKLWKILVIVFAALVVLFFIILVCVKLGFFKRRQMPVQDEAEEKEKLKGSKDEMMRKGEATKEELENLTSPMPVD